MGVPKDWTGQKFGLLTAVRMTDKRIGRARVWVCKCDCGNECERPPTELKHRVLRGKTPSCGCLFRDHRLKAGYKHGLARHPLHNYWKGIKQRCYDRNSRSYPNYGGRGIKVCDRWRDSVENFIADMEPSWQKGLTIDRIDVNGDYTPSNCRWVSQKVQNRNKRNNHLINGITVTEFAEKCGVGRETIYARIRRGVPDHLLSTPAGKLPKRFLEGENNDVK